MQVIRGKGAKAKYIEKFRSIVQKKNKVSSEQLKKEAENKKLIKYNTRHNLSS